MHLWPKHSCYPPHPQAFSEELQEAQQEVDEEKYSGLAASLGSPFILKHKDKEVCAHAASCLTQIFRIYVPQPVYDRKQLKASGWVLFQRSTFLCVLGDSPVCMGVPLDKWVLTQLTH